MTKRSTSSPRSVPLERPPLFLDATNDGHMLVDILRAAEWRVELHREHFRDRRSIEDHEWIPFACSLGCAIVTSDKRMRWWRTENGLVRPVIEQQKAKIFFLRSEGIELDEQAHAIGQARRDISRHFKNFAGSYLFARIHTTGNRLGEVQVLEPEGNRTQQKYGDVTAIQVGVK